MKNSKIIAPDYALENRVPKIVGLNPTGTQVLVEMLTVQEMANTIITVAETVDLKVPMQGYVKSVGPKFSTEDWGFGVGDRVLISGSGVIAPNFDDNKRDSFFMEPHAIRSVLLEG